MKQDENEIIYIEYQNGTPHSVVCSANGYCRYFDFEKSCYNDEQLMYYQSGGGGSIKDLQAPQYIDSCEGASYWMHDSASFSNKSQPKNITHLKEPLILQNNITNPFDEELSHEVSGMDFCKFCNKYYDENSCDEHHVWDEEENQIKYFDGTDLD